MGKLMFWKELETGDCFVQFPGESDKMPVNDEQVARIFQAEQSFQIRGRGTQRLGQPNEAEMVAIIRRIIA